MASSFVDLVGETGSLNFEPERVASDPDQKDDSRPDVTIYDVAERPRVFVEAAFWEGVPATQPVDYLRELPGDLPSALVYIAPRKRIRSLWEILHERCAGDPEIEVEDEPATDEAVRARAYKYSGRGRGFPPRSIRRRQSEFRMMPGPAGRCLVRL